MARLVESQQYLMNLQMVKTEILFSLHISQRKIRNFLLVMFILVCGNGYVNNSWLQKDSVTKKKSGKCGLKQYSVEVLNYSKTIYVLLLVLRLLWFWLTFGEIITFITNEVVSVFHRAFFNSIIGKHQHMHFFTFNTVLV